MLTCQPSASGTPAWQLARAAGVALQVVHNTMLLILPRRSGRRSGRRTGGGRQEDQTRWWSPSCVSACTASMYKECTTSAGSWMHG